MITQLDIENANYDLTTQQTVLTHTPNADAPVLCQGLIQLGDSVDDLDGTGGNFELTVSVGGQIMEPDPEMITFSTAVRTAVWTYAFPVPANAEVLLKIKSPNAGDVDVDVTASLHDVGVSVNGVCDEVITKATHNVPNSLAKRIRQVENVFIIHEGTAQGPGSGNNTIVLEATAHGMDDWYEEDWIILVENTGAGQMRHIDTYGGISKEAVLGSDWDVLPDNTTDYIIIARSSVHVHKFEALALTQVADAVNDEVIEGTLTLRQTMRLVLATLASVSSGGRTTTIIFKDTSGTKDRLTVTVDKNGNRSVVVRDVS